VSAIGHCHLTVYILLDCNSSVRNISSVRLAFYSYCLYAVRIGSQLVSLFPVVYKQRGTYSFPSFVHFCLHVLAAVAAVMDTGYFINS